MAVRRWTDFRIGPVPGILDCYTVLTGVLALVTLTVHGAHYLALKTEVGVCLRTWRVAALRWLALVLLTILSLTATLYVRPQVLDNFRFHVWGWVFPFLVVAALVVMQFSRAKGLALAAFLSSTAYSVGMLGGGSFAMYPTLLPASRNPSYSLTVHNAKTGAYGLRVGLVWWLIGMALAVGYFIFIYRSFRGKVSLKDEGGY